MLSAKDKLILENLKNTHSEAYELFLRMQAQHKEVVKRGCHDVRNIITVISGTYQLLDLTNKTLSELPRWSQLGRDIKYLIEAFNRIGYYRYADTVSLEKTTIAELSLLINEYNNTQHPEADFIFNSNICNNTINTDITKLFEAVTHLIDNAVEASCDYNMTDKMHITLSLVEQSEPHCLLITVENFCKQPDEKLLHSLTEPFTSNKSNRIGLGLAIAETTVDALNGTLSYDFLEDSCRFTISVPYNC